MQTEHTEEESVRVAREHKWRILARVFRYLLRFRTRVTLGLVLALIASLTNLISLGSFVPIFNVIAARDRARLFSIEPAQRTLHNRLYVRGRSLLAYGRSVSSGPAATPLPPGEPQEITLADRVNALVARFQIFANEELGGQPREAIVRLCLVILPIYLIKMLSVTGTVYFFGTAGLLAVREIRMDLYRKMNTLGLDYFQKERTGMIMSRIVNDAEVIGKTLSIEFNDALINLFYILTHLPVLLYMSWELSALVFLAGPLLIAPVSNLATRIRKAYAGQQERLAELGGHIHEVISGIRVIRAFSMERFEKRAFEKINERLFANTFRGHYFHQVGPALTELVASLVSIGILIYGAYEITIARAMQPGEFIGFFVIQVFIMRPIKQVSIMVNLLSGAAAAAIRIFWMLDEPDGVQSPKKSVPFPGAKREIVFDRVSFAYPGAARPALADVSFAATSGHTVSLVGASGAGKTTLMHLLPRFYDVSSGSIRVDGVDLREMDLKSLRTAIGVVSQDIFLFNATIRENIAYGRSEVTPERVEEAARIANAHEFIEKLPEGYDTPIGERGVMLSGGQRQRLAIARALLANPPVLIFDEATSSLDNESELLVQQAMDRLLEGRTVFIIAHRLSTVFRSNLILVMEEGSIVERGTHQELLDMGGVYRKLYDMQFSVPSA